MTQKRKAGFLFFFVLGTGCLLALLWKQNTILDRMNRQSIKWLVEMGADGSDTMAYLQRSDLDAKETWALKAVPVLSYLAGSQEEPTNNTIVVVVVCLVAGLFIFGIDSLFAFLNKVILG